MEPPKLSHDTGNSPLWSLDSPSNQIYRCCPNSPFHRHVADSSLCVPYGRHRSTSQDRHHYQEYFPKVVLSTFQGTLDSFEKRIARLLFKIAVEISVNNRITAATVDVTELNLQRLRARCVDDVKRINGSVSFPQAVDEELEYPLWDD